MMGPIGIVMTTLSVVPFWKVHFGGQRGKIMKSRSMRLVQGAAIASTLATSIFAFAGSSATVAGAAAKKVTIAFNVGAEADPFFQSMFTGASAEAKKLGVTLVWQGDPVNYSPSTQLPVLQELLALKPNAVVIAPTDTTAIAGITKQFVKAGIPVVNVDSGNAVQSNISAWVTGYNYLGGQQAADGLAKAMNYSTACMTAGACKVVVAVSSLTTSTDAARVKGFKDQVAKKYPNLTLLPAIVSNSESAVAQTKMAADLTANGSAIKGVFAVDGSDAVGVNSAIAAASATGVAVFGYDAYAANEASLASGTLAGIISQQPALEGKLAVQYAYDAYKHIKVPHLTLIPNIVLTAHSSAATLAKYVYQSA